MSRQAKIPLVILMDWANRDNPREELCAVLQNLGGNAQMAEFGRLEEGITSGRGRGRTFGVMAWAWSSASNSQGVIDIAEGPTVGSMS